MVIQINSIEVSNRKRSLNSDKVAEIAESFKLLGQLEPITVVKLNESKYKLVAGWHRLEAAKLLGWKEIEAKVFEGDSLECELAEIDENLMHNDLTILEQGEQLYRRNEILKELGLRAKRGDNRFTGGHLTVGGPIEEARGEMVSPLKTAEEISEETRGGDTVSHLKTAKEISEEARGGETISPPKTTAEIAKEAGLSARSAQRRLQVARDIDPEVKEVIRNTPIADSTTQLLELARLKPEEQKKVIEKIDNTYKISKAIQEYRREQIKEQLNSIVNNPVEPLNALYDVIVIDPPWKMKKIERDIAPNQVEFDYPTMTVEEIKALELPMADNCHVWLWTTQKYLPIAFSIIEYWGLKYICTFVWHKNGGFQPFELPQYNCEFALYARKGNPKFVDLKDFKLCFEAPRTGHSAKPDYFYELIKRVTAGRRLDMFSRRKIDGFDSWGKEAR